MHIRALEILVMTEMCAAILFPLVESSLSEETWQRTKAQLTPHSDASVINVTTDVAKNCLMNLMTFPEREVRNVFKWQRAMFREQ